MRFDAQADAKTIAAHKNTTKLIDTLRGLSRRHELDWAPASRELAAIRKINPLIVNYRDSPNRYQITEHGRAVLALLK